jgi:hypothetical protein
VFIGSIICTYQAMMYKPNITTPSAIGSIICPDKAYRSVRPIPSTMLNRYRYRHCRYRTISLLPNVFQSLSISLCRYRMHYFVIDYVNLYHQVLSQILHTVVIDSPLFTYSHQCRSRNVMHEIRTMHLEFYLGHIITLNAQPVSVA